MSPPNVTSPLALLRSTSVMEPAEDEQDDLLGDLLGDELDEPVEYSWLDSGDDGDDDDAPKTAGQAILASQREEIVEEGKQLVEQQAKAGKGPQGLAGMPGYERRALEAKNNGWVATTRDNGNLRRKLSSDGFTPA